MLDVNEKVFLANLSDEILKQMIADMREGRSFNVTSNQAQLFLIDITDVNDIDPETMDRRIAELAAAMKVLPAQWELLVLNAQRIRLDNEKLREVIALHEERTTHNLEYRSGLEDKIKVTNQMLWEATK